MVDPIAEVGELLGLFADVATVDPVSAVLLAVGAALVGAAVVVAGWLTLGAAVDVLRSVGA
ncbi:MAG: hypothetical protein ACLFMX_04675 [Halobacteriales archaeon]